jgi:hypothetical protein
VDRKLIFSARKKKVAVAKGHVAGAYRLPAYRYQLIYSIFVALFITAS